MYYRMTRLHFEEDTLQDLVDWLEAQKERIESIDGLMFWDLARGGRADGMVIAGYRDESAYQASSDVVTSIFEEMTVHLTNTPHGHDGTVVLSHGR